MPIDGPRALVQAEKALPLVQPASQEASSVFKQWHQDLGAAAAAVQPTPQHHLAKVEQRVDIEAPIEQPKDSAAGEKTPREPDRAIQLEAQAQLREQVLEKANKRQQRQQGRSHEEEDEDGEGDEGEDEGKS